MKKCDWEIRLSFTASKKKADSILKQIQETALHTKDVDDQYIHSNIRMINRSRGDSD